MRTLAIVLIILGALSLAYKGISYTKDRHVLDLGAIEATVEEKKTIPLSPALGAVAVAAGLVMLLGARKSI